MSGDGAGAGVRVALCAQRTVIAAGLRHVLQEADIEVVGCTSTVTGIPGLCSETSPQILLCEWPINGDLISAISEVTGMGLHVVLLSAEPATDDELFELLREGVSGWLTLDIPPDRLARALQGVAAGEAALPRRLVRKVLTEFSRTNRLTVVASSGRPVPLAPREGEVLRMLALDLSTDAMAGRLGVQAVTVRGYVSSLLRKLEVASRRDAAALLRK
jgi:DNA-binding NarL/FixJ family response regulator